MTTVGDRFQLSLDITKDLALQERVTRVMRAERRGKASELVRAAIDAYLEDAERRHGLVSPAPAPDDSRGGAPPSRRPPAPVGSRR